MDLVSLLIALPVLLLSLTIHEFAHGLVADTLGDHTARALGRLTVNPLRHLDPLGTLVLVATAFSGRFVFGWAKPVPVDPSHFRSPQRGMMYVGAAGPLANLAMAIVAGVTIRVLETTSAPARILDVFVTVFVLNIVLAVFNALPIPPLDGSRVLGGFLSPGVYRQWIGLDRYASYVFLGFVVLLALRPAALWVFITPVVRLAARALGL